MKVTITQQHIDQGERGSADACALALALQEATGYPHTVGYSGYWVATTAENKKTLSKEAQAFVRQFDGTHGYPNSNAEPCEIEVDAQ